MPARMLTEVIYHNYIIWLGVGGEEEEEEAREKSLQGPRTGSSRYRGKHSVYLLVLFEGFTKFKSYLQPLSNFLIRERQ